MSTHPDGAFGKLQRIAHSFAVPPVSGAGDAELRWAAELGATVVPLCLRHLIAGNDADDSVEVAGRRRWASALLTSAATTARVRVITALRELAASHAGDAGDPSDDAKVAALSLLAELGVAASPARFADPRAIQRRSIEQLASYLDGPDEIASAGELLVTRLPADEIVDLLEGLAVTAPERAARLIAELVVRLDLDEHTRSELRRLGAAQRVTGVPGPASSPSRPRAQVSLLRTGDGRVVVTACRRAGDRWRSIAVLIDADGTLADVMYRADDGGPEVVAREVVAPLTLEG